MLAVTPQGQPLGLLTQQFIDRPIEKARVQFQKFENCRLAWQRLQGFVATWVLIADEPPYLIGNR